MLHRRNIGTLLLLALAAEVVTFVAVVEAIGVGPALLLGLGSTLLGLSRLRRIGAGTIGRLRAMAEGRGGREDAFIDGALGTVGAILLLLPGFLTDLVGLALLAPSCREWVMARSGLGLRPPQGSPADRVRRSSGPQIIDLQSEDWSRIDRARPR